MAYVFIEGYMCERCQYRWGSRNGTGRRPKNDPKVCPKCKTPYWNRPRSINIPKERQAVPWDQDEENRPPRTRMRDPGRTTEEETDGTEEATNPREPQVAGR